MDNIDKENMIDNIMELLKPNPKKRGIDQVEGEVIHQDTFKRELNDPILFKCDSNKATFLRLGKAFLIIKNDCFPWIIENNPEQFGTKELIFHPEYTNQVFDQEEELNGYRDLAIDVHLLSGSLHAYLNVNFKECTAQADPIESKLLENVFNQGKW